MERQIENNLVCHLCQKEFSCVSTKNRHLKTIHQEGLERKNGHIKCPLCQEDEKISFGSHNELLNHLKGIHLIDIKESSFRFSNLEEFQAWRNLDNRNIDYAYQRAVELNNVKYMYYNCNRSNSRGYVSKCSKRSMKKGGSTLISGFCPSRIVVKVYSTEVAVTFIQTHVGHEDDVRAKRLTKIQQEDIAAKLITGVSKERIINDARIVENNEIQRINCLTRGDLSYIVTKYNIDKRRHPDDMIATALKVQEWNKEGENYVFLFKQIGEEYPGLKAEDFALAYMDKKMEEKLLQFKRIICIDGTHGTNQRNYDLTIILIKDDRNIGFPVAFLLSNRIDQVVQNIFFSALKTRVGQNIEADYIMTDDDIKYFNAWCKVMDTQKKPRHLLCTWHVIKNWNRQARNKLKKSVNREEMKHRMREILRETDIEKFSTIKDLYVKHLEEEGEFEFLAYLQNHYFKSEERIMMWAHCHRLNAGINTNMAIESLNKVIKYNKMQGKNNIRVEKLLDLLEEVVNDKMWKKVIQTVRPTANSYQCRVTRQAHSKAENILEKVICLDSGEFKVYSSSVDDKFYMVSYNELCDEDCRTLYCEKCEICIHQFKCDCSEYIIKTALCKHIQAVALVEKRSESVSGMFMASSEEDMQLFICEPTPTKVRLQTELNDFLEETVKRQESNFFIDSSRTRQIEYEQICMKMKELDDGNFQKFKKLADNFFSNINTDDNDNRCKRRKIEKQTYFPSKK